MKASIFTYSTVVVNYLPGSTIKQDLLPDRSVAVDGIVNGSFIDFYRERFSFDHHYTGLPRHSQTSSVKQIYDALVLGFKLPKTDGHVWVYMNDIDLDSIFSIFLLSLGTLKKLSYKEAQRLKEWVEVVNSSDIFGPAYSPDNKFIKIRDFLYYKILRKHKGKNAQSIITSILNNIHYYLKRDTVFYNKYNKKIKNLFILEKSNFIHPSKPKSDVELIAIMSEDPVFEYAYKMGAELVVGVRKKGLYYKYSIAKKHDFVPYDLLGLKKLLDERESGWGGASSIIGSPESGSLISPNVLLRLIKGHGETSKHQTGALQQATHNNSEKSDCETSAI